MTEADVEKVARALAEVRSWQTIPLRVGDWDDRSDEERQPFAELARAALESSPHAALEAEIKRLREALEALAQAEKTYRYAHDILGAGDAKTGRAWDLMRRAGDKARALTPQESTNNGR